MTGPVRDRAAMIAGMSPELQSGVFVFCCDAGPAHPAAIATMREAEGLSQVLPLVTAQASGFDTTLPMAQITLTVHSALDGVGLTAAVSATLAYEGIPCNVVAGYHHDHIFVPVALADKAVAALRAASAK